MRIVAAPGRLVRDPATRRPLPEEGIEVPDHDVHWARLLRDGDVQLGGTVVIDGPGIADIGEPHRDPAADMPEPDDAPIPPVQPARKDQPK